MITVASMDMVKEIIIIKIILYKRTIDLKAITIINIIAPTNLMMVTQSSITKQVNINKMTATEMTINIHELPLPVKEIKVMVTDTTITG